MPHPRKRSWHSVRIGVREPSRHACTSVVQQRVGGAKHPPQRRPLRHDELVPPPQLPRPVQYRSASDTCRKRLEQLPPVLADPNVPVVNWGVLHPLAPAASKETIPSFGAVSVRDTSGKKRLVSEDWTDFEKLRSDRDQLPRGDLPLVPLQEPGPESPHRHDIILHRTYISVDMIA